MIRDVWADCEEWQTGADGSLWPGRRWRPWCRSAAGDAPGGRSYGAFLGVGCAAHGSLRSDRRAAVRPRAADGGGRRPQYGAHRLVSKYRPMPLMASRASRVKRITVTRKPREASQGRRASVWRGWGVRSTALRWLRRPSNGLEELRTVRSCTSGRGLAFAVRSALPSFLPSRCKKCGIGRIPVDAAPVTQLTLPRRGARGA